MGVMALDVTVGYMQQLLVSEIDACGATNMRCFLMDDRGYLVAHPALIQPNYEGPVEGKHVTHKVLRGKHIAVV